MKLTDTFRQKLINIPSEPGVYKMLDKNGDIIYIGKSKNLNKRVRSYFTGPHKWSKVNNLAAQTNDIDYIVTDTHLEARILECELIKRYKPRYNSQMKNDRKYVYIRIGQNDSENPLAIANERERYCFGPFRSRFKISEFIENLKFFYPICKVNDRYNLIYHIIPENMDNDIFYKNRECLNEIFSDSNNMNKLIQVIAEKMEQAAAEYKFETAIKYRDIINSLCFVNNCLSRYRELTALDLIIKIPLKSGYKLFLISKGNIVAAKKYDCPTDNDIKNLGDLDYDKTSALYEIDEKARIDYMDIIFSEILTLPEENVIF